MGKRKAMGRKKEIRNANRTGGTSTRPDARTTLKIYTHFEEQRAREAVSRLDGFFGRLFGTQVTARLSALEMLNELVPRGYAGSVFALPVFAKLLGE